VCVSIWDSFCYKHGFVDGDKSTVKIECGMR
jgi:hypothetical protein